jgi:hypothetical protein
LWYSWRNLADSKN